MNLDVGFFAFCAVLCALGQGMILSTVDWKDRWSASDVFGFAAIELIVLAMLGGSIAMAVHAYRVEVSGWQQVCDEHGIRHGLVMVGKVAVPTTYNACIRSHYECPDQHCGALP